MKTFNIIRLSPMRKKVTKYIFVTGGVMSSLGKGLASACIGALLEARGMRVSLQKLDPYLNICLLYTSDAADD